MTPTERTGATQNRPMGTKLGKALDTMTDKTPDKVPGETGANKVVGDNDAQATDTTRRM